MIQENYELTFKFIVKAFPSLVILYDENVVFKGNIIGLFKIQHIDLIKNKVDTFKRFGFVHSQDFSSFQEKSNIFFKRAHWVKKNKQA